MKGAKVGSMKKAQKGICRGCKAEVRLLDSGKVRAHWVTVCRGDVHFHDRIKLLCGGTYRTPKKAARR